MVEEKSKLGAFPYVIAGISYIPLIGIIFGITSIIWGVLTKKEGGKKLALIGAGGILFSIILYATFFYFSFAKRGGQYDELRAKLAVQIEDQAIQAIEFYKTKNGAYPKDLAELSASLPKETAYIVNDPTDVKLSGTPRQLYYQLINETQYYLFSVGPDNQPFTKDDILPSIQPGGGIGYTIKIVQ